MKKVIFIFFIFFFNFIIAQDLKIDIQDIRTEDKIFSGMINNKYNISIYLKYYKLSEDNLGIYSVKGWYYYNKIKKKIPLVGVYDGSLNLFYFTNKQKQEKILDLDFKGSTWQVLDTIKVINDFNEKIVYSENDSSNNFWTDGKKKLNLDLYTNDNEVTKEYQILNISYKKEYKTINLSDIISYHKNFQLVNYVKDKERISILLKYNYNSRNNVQGMCGAGQEIGYLILIYSLNFELVNFEEIEIESCLNNVYSEEISNDLKDIKKLKITNSDNKSSIVTIDEKTIEFKIE